MYVSSNAALGHIRNQEWSFQELTCLCLLFSWVVFKAISTWFSWAMQLWWVALSCFNLPCNWPLSASTCTCTNLKIFFLVYRSQYSNSHNAVDLPLPLGYGFYSAWCILANAEACKGIALEKASFAALGCCTAQFLGRVDSSKATESFTADARDV